MRLFSGETLLLCRVEDRTGLSHLCAARSANGFDGWQIDAEPTLMANPREFPEEIWGIEDPRITYVPELEQYAVAYTSFARGGPGVSLALTKDFRSFKRFGVIMPPEDKDAALLPRRINGYWAMVHRPVTTTGAHMWISYSPNLQHWGDHKVILQARRGGWWDANKIGLCSPPIETPKGWLMIYHGVRVTASGSIYRLGLALFDLGANPTSGCNGETRMDLRSRGPTANAQRAGPEMYAGVWCISLRPDDRRGRGYDQPVLRRSRLLRSGGNGQRKPSAVVARRELRRGSRVGDVMIGNLLWKGSSG